MTQRSKVEEASAKMRALVESDDLISELRMANEAKTRLLLINRILSILGWDDREHNPELVTSTGKFTDYKLSIEKVFQLIVEAKRIGRIRPFALSSRKDEYDNITLSRHCGDEMKELLDQCNSYCQMCGLPFAVATTGEMWIVLINFKHGFDWGKLRAVVFHSLEDISKRFLEFYGLLSRDAVKENSLNLKFETIVPRPEYAVCPRDLVGPSADVGTVANKQIIASYFEHFMGDITRRNQKEMPDMLSHCYVNDHEIDGYARDLQQLLEYNAKLDEQDFAVSDADQETLEIEIALQLSTGEPRVILLVGNVGAGKSTFVHRFIAEHTNTEFFKRKEGKQSICAVVNLINKMSINIADEYHRQEHENLAELVLDELAAKFGKKFSPYDPTVVKGCFAVELKRFRENNRKKRELTPDAYEIEEEEEIGKWQTNKYKHLVAYIKYARRKYNTWIVFDNLDRGSASFQRFVYSFAHQLADEAGCVMMLTLREDTFLDAQADGIFDVRSNDKIFRIKAPEFRKVIAYRRRYVDHLLEHGSLPKALKSEADRIRLLNLHVRMLTTDSNGLIRDLITQMSLSNVRDALEKLKEYYVSYHSTLEEFCNRHKEKAEKEAAGEEVDEITLDYSKEYQRFVQALMLGNNWSYKEGKIFNIFSVSAAELGSHFLKLRILAYFVYHLEHKYTTHRIALKYETVYRDFLFLGFPASHVEDAIRSLLQAGLLVSPDLPTSPTGGSSTAKHRTLPLNIKVALSPRGRYYLKTLSRHPYYLTRVGDDMVWYDDGAAKAYVGCLEESILLQEREPDDALQATDAKTVLVEYLKKRLSEEMQIKDSRLTATDWAKSIKQTIEQMILGSLPMDDTIFAHIPQIDTTQSDAKEHKNGRHEPPALPSKDEREPATEEPVARQMNLFGKVVDEETSIKEAVAFVGPMPTDTKHDRSRYIVRVLWALEVAYHAGIGTRRAADITRIICKYGNERVERTNVARFFRDENRSNSDYTRLWKEEQKAYFEISPEGREFIQAILHPKKE